MVYRWFMAVVALSTHISFLDQAPSLEQRRLRKGAQLRDRTVILIELERPCSSQTRREGMLKENLSPIEHTY